MELADYEARLSLTFFNRIGRVQHRWARWSNDLIKASADLTVLERRMCYFITNWVNANYKRRQLDQECNWDKLLIEMTLKDLGIICSNNNKKRTMQAVEQLMHKKMRVYTKNDFGVTEMKHVKWIEAFYFDKAKKKYVLQISRSIRPYLIGVDKNFTTLDLGVALNIMFKGTQRLYEICSRLKGKYRYKDERFGQVYKMNVCPITIKAFRNLLGLNELKDEEGNIICKQRYNNFNAVEKNVIQLAQTELYVSYMHGLSDVWFDYQLEGGSRKGKKITRVTLFVYSKAKPKVGPQRPWEEGDAPLNPFKMGFGEEIEVQEGKDTKVYEGPKTPYDKMRKDPDYGSSNYDLREKLFNLLLRYLNKTEARYYLDKTDEEAQKNKWRKGDIYMNVIHVIHEKEHQNKFKTKNKAWQRNNLVNFVFTRNLMSEFKWFIPPVNNVDYIRNKWLWKRKEWIL